MLLLFKSNSKSYHYTGASHWRKNIVAVITQNRVIDEHLKRQIKNRTLYTCRSFLLNRIFQYIGNWSKVTEYLPTLFFQYAQSNNFSQFFYINNFSVDYAGLHINWAVTSLFIYHSWHISNFETTYEKRPFIKVAFFSDVV